MKIQNLVILMSMGAALSIASGCGKNACSKYQDFLKNCETSATATFNESACETAYKGCTSDEQKLLDANVDCYNTNATCSNGAITNQTAVSTACVFPTVSASCSTALAAAGLGSSSGQGVSKGSCNITNGGQCIDFTGSGYTSSTAQSSCPSSTGTFSTTACVTTSKVGSCTVRSGQATEQVFTYYSPTFSASTAQSTCTQQSGTFTSALRSE